ncbi:MAG: hypothetical protein J5I98_06210 [Phaeodactylibacter sp.]|nr:hypothetical protein [Phaeodactylibacter sp.]
MEPVITKQDAEHIMQLISSGLLLEALEYAKKEYRGQFIHFLARYNELEKSNVEATLTKDEYLSEKNRLRIGFVRTVEENLAEEDEAPEITKKKENNNPERDRMPSYLEGLELHPFAAGLEKLLLMEPEFFPTMDHYKGDKILTYYYLQEQQLNFRKALQRLSEVETNKNDFDERLIDIFKLLEKQGEQFSRALKKSGNNGIPLFAELERILKDINMARKELVRAIVAGHNSIEKSRLVDITLPQLEIGLEELIASIGKARDEIAHFSRN